MIMHEDRCTESLKTEFLQHHSNSGRGITKSYAYIKKLLRYFFSDVSSFLSISQAHIKIKIQKKS